ncbi:hypothetical protein, partial [Vibrio fluvialis]|uniref:hypothetical protein n=1 Tax=Vibrio fluvialis TaxID=676 RepID=UPI0011809747
DRPADGETLKVDATITDAAGNTSAPGTDSAATGGTTPTAAPTGTITEETNNDGTISNTQNDGKVNVS